MVLVGDTEPISPRLPVDGVVAALSRLIVASRAGYREPLLDALFVYRRREGLFIDGERIPPKLFKHPQRKREAERDGTNVRTFRVTSGSILRAGSRGGEADDPALASPGRLDEERGRYANSLGSRPA